MPNMVLNRKYVLDTCKGHRIVFEKGKPTPVPKEMYADAVGIGAELVEGETSIVTEKQKLEENFPQELKPLPQAPEVKDDRMTAIKKAIHVVLETGGREDFTAAGMPKEKTLARVLGYNVDRKEIGEAWREYHKDKANEE